MTSITMSDWLMPAWGRALLELEILAMTTRCEASPPTRPVSGATGAVAPTWRARFPASGVQSARPSRYECWAVPVHRKSWRYTVVENGRNAPGVSTPSPFQSPKAIRSFGTPK